MTSLPNRRARVNGVNSLPLFDWADRHPSRNHHISPLVRTVRQRWGYGPEAAKAVCEAWGFDGAVNDD